MSSGIRGRMRPAAIIGVVAAVAVVLLVVKPLAAYVLENFGWAGVIIALACVFGVAIIVDRRDRRAEILPPER